MNSNILYIIIIYILLHTFKNINNNTSKNNIIYKKNNNVFNKLKYVSEGVASSFKNDNSIIFAYSFSIPLSILNIVFAPNLLSKLLGIILFSLLIIFETLNTSIEATVDRIGLEHNILSKLAKDTAAIPSTIISIIFFIFIGMMTYYIYLELEKFKKENKDNLKNDKTHIIIQKYIKHTFSV